VIDAPFRTPPLHAQLAKRATLAILPDLPIGIMWRSISCTSAGIMSVTWARLHVFDRDPALPEGQRHPR